MYFAEKILNKSNSYRFYKNSYETLTKENKELKEKLENSKNKIYSLNAQVENIQDLNSNISNLKEDSYGYFVKSNQMLNELHYGFVFNDTIKESEWLIQKDFSLVNAAANYSFLYSLFRFLNDAQPKCILELGLGQSTKITSQYANHFKDSELVVLEGDQDWIDIFSQKLNLNENISIHKLDLESFDFNGNESIRFKDVLNIVGDRKFNLIIIDAPQGFISDEKGSRFLNYSRTNIWDLIPNNLAEDFIIIIDDHERDGEKNTINHVKELLNENEIEFYTYSCFGLKEQYAIFSKSYMYLSWI